MSKISLNKKFINQDHIEFLQGYFNEKTASKAILRAIEYLATDFKADNEKIQETMKDYLHRANKYEKLKDHLLQIAKSENRISKIINE